MITKRIIPCLDIKNGRVVKGTNFQGLSDVSSPVELAKLYSAEDGSELSMVFQFQHMCLDQKAEKWDFLPLYLPDLKKCYNNWQQGLHGEGWNSLFMNNHDLPRIVSRWGNDKEYRKESAKMLAIVLHGLQGTPYIATQGLNSHLLHWKEDSLPLSHQGSPGSIIIYIIKM